MSEIIIWVIIGIFITVPSVIFMKRHDSAYDPDLMLFTGSWMIFLWPITLIMMLIGLIVMRIPIDDE